MKISIIIPVYNVENYLRVCLDSVVNQTYSDLEIICINDGSTDASLDILNEYAKNDSRILVVSQSNRGLAAARNTGLEYVTGELCYFLDSDDYIERNLIEYAVKIFENFDVDYFCFSSKAFLDGENISQDFDIIADYITVKRDGVFDVNFDIGLGTNIHVWNKIFKTSNLISNNIKFIDGLLYEDIYFMWNCVFHSKRAYFDTDFYHYYRIRSNSIMENTNKNKSFVNAVSHLYNWHELFLTLKNDMNLFSKNYNNLLFLLNMYRQRTKEMVNPSEKYKVEKLYQSYLREITEFNNYLYLLQKAKKNLKEKLFSVEKAGNHWIYRLLFFKIKFKHNVIHKIINQPLRFLLSLNLALIQLGKSKFDVFCKTNTKNSEMEDVLRNLGEFYFLPNRGNLGDIAIATSCYQFFDSKNMNYSTVDMSLEQQSFVDKPFNLVYGGGGLFTKYYRQYYQDILNLFRSKNLQNAVIMPASFYECRDVLAQLDERFTVFCREKQSYEYCVANNSRAKFILADDMVIGLDTDYYKKEFLDKNNLKSFLSKNGKENFKNVVERLCPFYFEVQKQFKKVKKSSNTNIGYFLRTDDEKFFNPEKSGLESLVDLSLCASSFCADKAMDIMLSKLFLGILDSYDVIVSDRLHIGICSALLGKEVYLLDNSYKKVSNVYKNSLKNNKKVHLYQDVDSMMRDLSKIKNKMNIKRIKTFGLMNFLLEYGSIKNQFGAEKIIWRN